MHRHQKGWGKQPLRDIGFPTSTAQVAKEAMENGELSKRCPWQAVNNCSALWEQLLLFSHSVVSNSSWPHGLQHTSLSCPSLSPAVSQTHVHWVGMPFQPSHSLPCPFIYRVSVTVFVLQWQGWIAVAETSWPTSLTYLLSGPEEVCRRLL